MSNIVCLGEGGRENFLLMFMVTVAWSLNQEHIYKITRFQKESVLVVWNLMGILCGCPLSFQKPTRDNIVDLRKSFLDILRPWVLPSLRGAPCRQYCWFKEVDVWLRAVIFAEDRRRGTSLWVPVHGGSERGVPLVNKIAHKGCHMTGLHVVVSRIYFQPKHTIISVHGDSC